MRIQHKRMHWIKSNSIELINVIKNAPVEYVGPRGGKNARTIKDENDDHIWAAPYAHWHRALKSRCIDCPHHKWYRPGAWGKAYTIAIPRSVADYILENAPKDII